MAYVDAYVLPVPRANLEAYRAMATFAETVWRENGAIDYREWIADDVPPGEHTSFPLSVKLKDDEVVIFAYAIYPSRAVRDEAMAKIMADPRMNAEEYLNIFDGKRMFWGGFSPFVPA